MIDGQTFLTPKLPWGIRIEMLTPGDDLLRQVRDAVMTVGVPRREVSQDSAAGEAAEPSQWFADLMQRHRESDSMIVVVRTGRVLAACLVLDLAERRAPLAWIGERFRGRGLGMRFYASACTNLSTPRPEFVLHKTLREEFAPILKELASSTLFNDPFYVLNPAPAETREAA